MRLTVCHGQPRNHIIGADAVFWRTQVGVRENGAAAYASGTRQETNVKAYNARPSSLVDRCLARVGPFSSSSGKSRRRPLQTP